MAKVQNITTNFRVNYKDWEEFEGELKDVQRTYDKTEKEIVQGNKDIERSSRKMTNEVISGFNGMGRKVEGVRGSFRNFTNRVDRTNRALKSFRKTTRDTGMDFRGLSELADDAKKNTEGWAKSNDGLGISMDKVGKQGKESFGGIGQALKGVQSLFLAGAIFEGFQVIVGYLAESARLTSGFENALASLSAITGATGADLDAFAKSAASFTIEITKANGEIVAFQEAPEAVLKAFELVGSARPQLLQSREALEEVTKQALILSRASGLTLEESVRSLATVLNQFNADAGDTSKIINVLGEGSKLGAAPIARIAEAVGEFGTSANSANLSIPETVALVEALADKTIFGARAGIQLRNILAILGKGAEETNPAIVGLDTALENLAAQNLSAAEITKRFGLENQEAAKVLIQNRDRVQSLTASLSEQGLSTALDQAATKLGTTAAQVESMRNQIEANRIEIGQDFLPVQLQLTQAQLEFTKALAAVIKEGEAFSNEFRGVREIMGILGGAVDAVNSGFKSLGIEINLAKVTATVLGSALSNALGFGLVEQIGRTIARTKELFFTINEYFGFLIPRSVEVEELTKDHILYQEQVTKKVEETTKATQILGETESKAAKDRGEDLQKQLEALRLRAELLQADADERINIQEKREIAELKQAEAFQALQRQNEEAANALLDEVRAKYAGIRSERRAAEAEEVQKMLDAQLAYEKMFEDNKEAIRAEAYANKQAEIIRQAAEETLVATQRIETEEQLQEALAQIEVSRLENMLELRKQFGEDTIELEQQLADKRRAIRLKASEDAKEAEEKGADDFANNLRSVLTASSRFFQEITRARIAAAGDDDEKIKQIRREEFARNQALALADVAINTAVGISAALKNPATAPFIIPLITGIGLAQATAIASQKPPVFHEGTDYATENGGSSPEFYAKIERGERIVDKETNATYKTDLDAVHSALKNRALRVGELESFVVHGANFTKQVDVSMSIDYKKLAQEVAQAMHERQLPQHEEMIAAIMGGSIDMNELAKALKWVR